MHEFDNVYVMNRVRKGSRSRPTGKSRRSRAELQRKNPVKTGDIDQGQCKIVLQENGKRIVNNHIF